MGLRTLAEGTWAFELSGILGWGPRRRSAFHARRVEWAQGAAQGTFGDPDPHRVASRVAGNVAELELIELWPI